MSERETCNRLLFVSAGRGIVSCVLCEPQTLNRRSAVYHAKMHVRRGEAAMVPYASTKAVECRYAVVGLPVVPVSRAAGGEIECPDCGGAGYGDDGHPESPVERTCITCGGKGRLNAEKWADAAVMATWLALGAWKDGTRDDAFAKDRLRWLYRKAARALSSAPAPEEPAVGQGFPEGSYEIPLARRLEVASKDGPSIPRLGIAGTDKHSVPLTSAEATQLLGLLTVAVPAPSSPGAGSPVADNRAIVPLLMGHWLTAVECDHDAKTDKAACFCGWASAALPTVGDAVCAWAEHVASFAAPPAAGREPSEVTEAMVEREWNATRTPEMAEWRKLNAGSRAWQLGWAIRIAALGASAQRNTGEGG